MKRIFCASILALFALGFATPQSARAQTPKAVLLTLDDDLTSRLSSAPCRTRKAARLAG